MNTYYYYLAARMRATIKMDAKMEQLTIVPQSGLVTHNSWSNPQTGSGFGGTPDTHWIGFDSLMYRNS